MLLPDDFKEFLKLLNENHVDYLLIGGFAVGYHGYPRATADLDVWVALSPENAERLIAALVAFGFSPEAVAPQMVLSKDRILRMGVPPLRLEIHTGISGVTFAESYAHRVNAVIDAVEVPVISLADLIANKKASGRPKDLIDIQELAIQLPPNKSDRRD